MPITTMEKNTFAPRDPIQKSANQTKIMPWEGDAFTIYWRLLTWARAEHTYIAPEVEVELFERAIEISESHARFENRTICAPLDSSEA